MESSEVVKIRVENIYPHPDNPRKDLGDVTELAESMKKHGVMQNLTVIPASALTADPEDQPDADKVSVISDFHALIGHRRLEAAKLAGLVEVPCQIRSKISRKEQVGIMLLENIQREDLTIQEQAQPSNCLGGSLRWMRRSKFWTEQVSYLHLRKKSKLLTCQLAQSRLL